VRIILQEYDRGGYLDTRKELMKKSQTTKPGTVERVIKSPIPDEPEKAQILVEGADELYREIRIENTLTDAKGDEVKLKEGAEVEIIVEAGPEATTSTGKGKRAKSDVDEDVA
jgi:hypothetical protein